MPDAYVQLVDRLKDIGRLTAVQELLDWDQETYMPAKGVAPRAETSAMVAALVHSWRTSTEMGDLLGALG
ncbi:MAG: carboxypeptidase M32, partial [Planctomycetota bacterium]